jgi:hypothetical protein
MAALTHAIPIQPHVQQSASAVAAVNQDTQVLVGALRNLSQALPGAIWGLSDDTLPAPQQAAFGAALVDVGQAVQRHARDEPCWVSVAIPPDSS